MFGKHNTSVLALAAFVAIGVLMPDMSSSPTGRQLSVQQQSFRRLTSTPKPYQIPSPPPGFVFNCPADKELITLDWTGVQVNPKRERQTVTLQNGMNIVLTMTEVGTGEVDAWQMETEGPLIIATTKPDERDIITAGKTMEYPDSYISLGIEFEKELDDLFISVGDIDTTTKVADATRIRMYDASDNEIDMDIASNNNDVKVIDNYAYSTKKGFDTPLPGFDYAFYAKAKSGVKKIFLDESVYIYSQNKVGKRSDRRGVMAASDFRFCADPASTDAPEPTPEPTDPDLDLDNPDLDPQTCDNSKRLFRHNFDGTKEHNWKSAKFEENAELGRFMGRFANDDEAPNRTFNVGKVYDFIEINFDFIEFDSWDNSTLYGRDELVVHVNDEAIPVGVFVGGGNDDGARGGETPNGIDWVCVAKGEPDYLGGSPDIMDQVHHFTAWVPKDLYESTGKIKLSMEVLVNQGLNDESGGFDNIILNGLRDCDIDGGVNGDPLIMGLAGQLFKFEGRSGSWYSAVSTSSFQWNMRIQQYDECPAGSDKFVSGVGFTLTDPSNPHSPPHKVVVNVVNPYNVQTGCGTGATNCLGNGSVEIVIDGEKLVYPGDYRFKDGSGRVIAFNTFFECARRWYDFDNDPVSGNLRNGRRVMSRRLETFPGVFDVMRELEDNMVDKNKCDQWIADRQDKNDLFHQGGEWSTIIVKTDTVSFHVEYKQEHKRCNAHTIDVWIAGVSPEVFEQEWHGIIGETKDPKRKGSREDILKFSDDDAYVVTSPFSTECAACHQG